eukprot:scaffold78748_cov72-Phaeocystis_antarctica.AAC.6
MNPVAQSAYGLTLKSKPICKVTSETKAMPSWSSYRGRAYITTCARPSANVGFVVSIERAASARPCWAWPLSGATNAPPAATIKAQGIALHSPPVRRRKRKSASFSRAGDRADTRDADSA